MQPLKNICTDFEEWPSRWMGADKDLEYGRKLLEELRPFAEEIASSGLSKKTITKHIDNLWLIGGEIIRDVSLNEKCHEPPIKILEKSVDEYGGPYCRHLYTDNEKRSYDSTCKKLAKFLASRNNG